MRPDRAVRSLRTAAPLGADAGGAPTPARRSATRSGPRIVDERGTLTFEEVHRRTNALARALGRAGIAEGDGVAIMCRNHRGFIEATVACSKLGAGALYLNTAFAGPQIADVIEREDPVAVIYDEEFAELVQRWRRPTSCASSPGARDRRRSTEQGGTRSAARGADRTRRRLRSDPAARARARGDPDLGHDRHAEGRAAHSRPTRSSRPRRCSRRSRCGRARRR